MTGQDSTTHEWTIQIQGLTKSFGDDFALRGIDLKVEWGESIALFGPNGAGKTTLIKILATIMKPSSGTILINGLNIKDAAEKSRRQIGVVTHQTFLYNNLTAYENLQFYCRMYDMPEARIREVVEQVEMTSRLHDRVGMLSRGMQQRLSIARSLLHKPSIMLLDEPETGLDQQAVSILWQVLRAEGEIKRTIILTTHSLERGLSFSDRLLILDRGKIVYQKPSHTLDLAGLKEAYYNSTQVKV